MYKQFFAVLLLTVTAISCSPALHPLYRDYEHDGLADSSLLHQIEEALKETGWELTSPPSPNAVATAEREIRDWLLYKVVVQVEAVPLGTRHVRLLVHPYRIYITGSRSKIPFLKRGIRQRVVRDIDKAFQARNLTLVGTDMSRDEVRTR